MKKSFFSLTFTELKALLEDRALNSSAASLLYNWYYKKKNLRIDCHLIAEETRRFLAEELDFSLPEIFSVTQAADLTVKFLFQFPDGKKVEAVLIPFNKKYSLCLSSQVGCAMKCSFCFTGTQNLERHLKTEEIIGQFLVAYEWLIKNRGASERILNLVFMGQGEPLHNFDQVKKACEIFLSQHGASLAAQKITVSTSGYIPGLLRWKAEMPAVNLALSLHSPITAKRNELIPLNIRYPLKDVLELIDTLPLAKKQFVTYEYLLIEDFNDDESDARLTGELLQGKRAYINLIPFNPYPGTPYKRPARAKVENFKRVLDTYKIPTLIRIVKGDEALAACGQLNSKGRL